VKDRNGFERPFLTRSESVHLAFILLLSASVVIALFLARHPQMGEFVPKQTNHPGDVVTVNFAADWFVVISPTQNVRVNLTNYPPAGAEVIRSIDLMIMPTINDVSFPADVRFLDGAQLVLGSNVTNLVSIWSLGTNYVGYSVHAQGSKTTIRATNSPTTRLKIPQL